MYAYIASSPYQIFTCLNMLYPFAEEADIYIINQFANCSELVNRIKDGHCFRRTVMVENMTGRKRNRVKDFLNRNCLYSIKAQKYIEHTAYEKVFYAALDATVYMLIKTIKKNNPSVNINKYEDGLGEYTSGELFFPVKKDYLFYRIFGGTMLFGEEEYNAVKRGMYVYEPSLLPEIKKSPEIKAISFSSDQLLLNKLNTVFGYEVSDIPKERVLFFDAAITGGSISEMDELLKKTVTLADKFFPGNVGIKLHPRRTENIYGNINYWGRQEIPAEVIYANMGDCLSDKILVGIISTTVITPYIILKKEPYIISMHKILGKCNYISQEHFPAFSRVLTMISDMYKTKNKVFMPETMEELENIFTKLSRK